MRVIPIVLTLLLVLVQHPLWLGDGGWLRVWERDRQLTETKLSNVVLANRNGGLEAEVRDLAIGHIAVEERARYELGMIGADEIFIQINETFVVPQGPARIRTVDLDLHRFAKK